MLKLKSVTFLVALKETAVVNWQDHAADRVRRPEGHRTMIE